jgi:ABC-type transport system substrate-binding protein
LFVAFVLMTVLLPIQSINEVQGQETEEMVLRLGDYQYQAAWDLTPFTTRSYDIIHPFCDVWSNPLAFWMWQNDTWVPMLAETWEWNADTLEFTAHLREGVNWHHGTEFNSEDVLIQYTVEHLLMTWPGEHPIIESVTAPDEHTVVWKLNQDTALAAQICLESDWGQFCPRDGWIARFGNSTVRALMEAGTSEAEATLTALQEEYLTIEIMDADNIYGTGAFIPTMISTTGFVFEKDPDWWAIDALGWESGFDKVEIIEFGSHDVFRMAFLRGEIVYAHEGVAGPFIDQFLASPEEYIRRFYAVAQILQVPLDARKYPMSIKEVRQAMWYAADQEDQIEAYGRAYPLWTAIPKLTLLQKSWLDEDGDGEWEDEEFVQRLTDYGTKSNLEKATEILESVGITERDDEGWLITPNGTRLEFTVLAPSAYWLPSAEVLKYNWEAIGIKINTELALPGEWHKEKAGVDAWTKDIYNMEFTDCPHPTQLYLSMFQGHKLGRIGVATWAQGIRTKYFVQEVEVPDWVVPDAGTVNITDLAWEMNTVTDRDRMSDIIRIMTWYINEYVPAIPMCEKPMYNVYQVRPSGVNYYMDRTLLDTYEDFDPIYYGWRGKPAGLWVYGWVQPIPLELPPPITFMSIWITKAVEAFTGADGKEYGPFEAGTEETIPEEDANRLLGEGSALSMQVTTLTETVTQTETVTTIDMTGVAGAGIIALIVGVIVGWLVGKR